MEEYRSKELIYEQGARPLEYFQIISGTFELINYHEDGKEFTLDILTYGANPGGIDAFFSQTSSDQCCRQNRMQHSETTQGHIYKTDF